MISGLVCMESSHCNVHYVSYIITVPTGLMVPWPFALMHCWELLLAPQTADFGHQLASAKARPHNAQLVTIITQV